MLAKSVQVFTIILLTSPVIYSSADIQNTFNTTITWNTFENLNNSDWTINLLAGDINIYSKPSDLDPNLRALDSNFSGNVWGSDINGSRLTCLNEYQLNSLPKFCERADITLRIKYFHRSLNKVSYVGVWPVIGLPEAEIYYLPINSNVQWNDVSLRMKCRSLKSHALSIFHSTEHGDILIFDEISLIVTETWEDPIPILDQMKN